MAYDEELAERVRALMAPYGPVDEIKMFGGLCFTVRGNMAIGVTKDDLMVRVGPDQHEAAMAKAGARPMDFTNKPMKGFVFVGPNGTTGARALKGWVEMGANFASSLPPKAKKKRKPKAV